MEGIGGGGGGFIDGLWRREDGAVAPSTAMPACRFRSLGDVCERERDVPLHVEKNFLFFSKEDYVSIQHLPSFLSEEGKKKRRWEKKGGGVRGVYGPWNFCSRRFRGAP